VLALNLLNSLVVQRLDIRMNHCPDPPKSTSL
jgi:hypothetical protein